MDDQCGRSVLGAARRSAALGFTVLLAHLEEGFVKVLIVSREIGFPELFDEEIDEEG